MAYFKINGFDYSKYVSALKVNKSSVYNAQTNAAGNTVVDYINSKRVIEVSIIALDNSIMPNLLGLVDGFDVNITYLNPRSNKLEEVNCIVPDDEIEYYTIQSGKVLYKAFNLKFTEL